MWAGGSMKRAGDLCALLPGPFLAPFLLLVLLSAGTPGAHSDVGDSAGAAKLLQVKQQVPTPEMGIQGDATAFLGG